MGNGSVADAPLLRARAMTGFRPTELKYALLDGEVWVHKRDSTGKGDFEKQTYVR